MTCKGVLVLRWVAWFVSVLIMVLTFLSSSQTAEVSSNTSGSIIKAVLTVVVDDFEDLPAADSDALVASFQHLARKTAHFMTYFMLGISLFIAFYTYSIKRWLKYFLAATVCLVYAVSDEIHQAFVPGRGPQITDVFLDFAGSVTGILLATLIVTVAMRIRRRRNGK